MLLCYLLARLQFDQLVQFAVFAVIWQLPTFHSSAFSFPHCLHGYSSRRWDLSAARPASLRPVSEALDFAAACLCAVGSAFLFAAAAAVSFLSPAATTPAFAAAYFLPL